MPRSSALCLTGLACAALSTGCDFQLPSYVAGVNGSAEPRVNIFDGAQLQKRSSFLMFDSSFTGGVRVAVGDVNGDGLPDLIGGAGPGGWPQVKIRDGRGGATIRDFFAYDTAFAGGVFVAVGDVNNDGKADIITGAGPGGNSHVKVFSGVDNTELSSFFAFAGFGGGARVASGKVNTDAHADIIVGAGPGAGPQMIVFDGTSLTPIHSFFAYSATFTGGVFVAAGDVNGDGRADIITGADGGGPPHVKVFSGVDGSELLSFFAYDPSITGGVRVGAIDANSDGRADILCGPGPGGGSNLKVFNGNGGALLSSFNAFDTGFTDGIFVAGGLYTLSSLAALGG